MFQGIGSCYTVQTACRMKTLLGMQGALYDESYYMCYVAGCWDGEWWRRIQCGDGWRCRDRQEGRVEPQQAGQNRANTAKNGRMSDMLCRDLLAGLARGLMVEEKW